MKRTSLLFLFCLTGTFVYSQTEVDDFEKTTVSVGIDVFKNLPPLLLGDSYFIQNAIIIEPSLRINHKAGRAWLIHLGLMKASTNKNLEIENILSPNIRGVYLKAGWEREFEKRKSMVVGWNGMLSLASYDGILQLSGPTFGDYRGSFSDNNNVAVGVEMYFAHNSSLKGKWNLRTQARMTLALRSGGEIKPFYYPGVGVTEDMIGVLCSVGVTFQVFRQIR